MKINTPEYKKLRLEYALTWLKSEKLKKIIRKQLKK